MNISKVTNYIINQIHSPTFIEQHKFRIQDFTRDRILNFQILFVTIMRKSIKSLQIVLNELFMDGHIEKTVTNSAFTQARQKLSHTAFLELSKDIVAMQYEEPKDLNLWNGYRMLGVDSSQIILPYTKEIMTEFGSIKIKTAAIDGAYVSARFECCYDVLNRLTIAGTLDKGDIELAERILDAAVENDILIYDRGYCSYKFIAILLQQKKHFVIRCKRSFFKAVTAFFNGEQADKVFNIPVPAAQNKVIKYLGLPLTITVRFVAVPLPTGEIEVLMTSLLDSNINKEEFKKLYGFRWEVETFFGVLKSRLSLENFTGLTVEAIKQNFWSTIMKIY
ncbi:MAG: IS4 family transposase [Candidatus Megaira endosymbiont of Mesostigma viride]|nr:MAG: IS4 family transposase [Candidatus Megaira endosymbiont of Mesostigma viride]HJK88261.1 IS4 family transposase [Candidatus Megaira endosymbiont of Mesostigma viride]